MGKGFGRKATEALSDKRSQINNVRRTGFSSPYEPREHYPEPPDREVNTER